MFISRRRLRELENRIQKLEDNARLVYCTIGDFRPVIGTYSLQSVVVSLLDHLKLDVGREPAIEEIVKLTKQKPKPKRGKQ